MMGMRPPMGFDTLTEEEKKKVREAMAKAWNRPEVITARDKAMEANEQMRHTLQVAIKEIDPEVDAILEKIKPPYALDHRGLPLMPKPESPDFIKFVGIRLRAELMSIAKPGRHEETDVLWEVRVPSLLSAASDEDALAAVQRAVFPDASIISGRWWPPQFKVLSLAGRLAHDVGVDFFPIPPRFMDTLSPREPTLPSLRLIGVVQDVVSLSEYRETAVVRRGSGDGGKGWSGGSRGEGGAGGGDPGGIGQLGKRQLDSLDYCDGHAPRRQR